MHIADHKVVEIHYTLTNTDGEILDTSREGDPLSYIHGIGNIIPGLEKALTGRAVGDCLKVSIEPEDAYGARDDDLVRAVPRGAFQGVPSILPGMQFHAQSAEGLRLVTVVDVDEDEVIVDGNHPLAGLTLNFDVEVKDVRDATQEELEHGHVHGPGGHHHHD